VRYPALHTVQAQELMHVHRVRKSEFAPVSLPSPREIDMDPHNGISAAQLPALAWQKSRRSNPSGNCVELAELPDGAGIAVRNSRDPEGPALSYTFAEIAAFIEGARDGDFDNLVA
jgi:Domain of unknown function (DUF397)